MWGMIATWRMAVEGITEGADILRQGGDAGDAVETAVREVENFPYYKSVGYGGLPNEEMEVELDAAFMDGDTLDIGAVAAIRDFANPVSIARRLSREKVNSMLVAEGAEKFAHKEGFERKNMLTDRAKAHYRKRLREMAGAARAVEAADAAGAASTVGAIGAADAAAPQADIRAAAQAILQDASQELKPYSGHDTVAMACLDGNGKMTAATSTSGLFMKKKGRVGDSPISGSGFYADSKRGAAGATGLGEDLMKGCISYEIVRLMGEGMHPQAACETAVSRLDAELRERRGQAGDLSVIAMNPKGEWGAAANIDGFSFAVAAETLEPTVYLVKRGENGRCMHEKASDEWMENYMRTRMAPVEE